MKTSTVKSKWLAPLALVIAVLGASQMFIACGSKGDAGSGGTVAVPPGVNVGCTNPAVPCVGGVQALNSANLLASAIGRMIAFTGTPGYEIQIQIAASNGLPVNPVGVPGAAPIFNGGLGSQYSGPVQIAGLINVFPVQGSALCMPVPGTYTFNQGFGNFDSSSNGIQGQIQATGPGGVITVNLYNTFLRSVIPASVSLVNGQNFPYQLLNQVQLSGVGVQTGFQGQQIQCGLGGSPDFLGAF